MKSEPQKFLFVYRESRATEKEGNVYFLACIEQDELKFNQLRSSDMESLAINAYECDIEEIPCFYPINTGKAIKKDRQGEFIRTATWDEIDKFNKYLRAEI
jgi:hypothetical protein